MISITKHLDVNTKWLEILFWYDFANGIIDEEEEILLQSKSNFFTIRMITLLKLGTLLSNDIPKFGSKELKFDFLHTLGNILVDDVPA